MADILLVNDDNKAPASAKVGDLIVTGGGIYRMTANGGVRDEEAEKASGYSGGVGNYNTLATEIYNKVRTSLSSSGGKSGGSSGGTSDTPTPTPNVDASNSQQPQDINVNYDVNGIGYLDGVDGIEGYNPYDYVNYSPSGSSSETISNFFGYVLLGLVGLVILDRIVAGGGK